MKLHLRQRLLASTLLIGAATMGAPAWAQTATPPIDQSKTTDPSQTTDTTGPIEGSTDTSVSANGDQDVENGGDIIVTGSRIPQPNLTSASPVTVINSQEVRLSGTVRAEDLINSLPQAFASQGSSISNGASGTATINLRGLGDTRTLVLINGRRLLPGDPSSPVADINVIPATLIKRVDVLTGGASSVYGADAVSGVVNFILDTNFEGFRLDAQYSLYDHNNHGRNAIEQEINRRGFPNPNGHRADGGTYDINGAFGASFADNRGHVTAYVGYRKSRSVLQANRDFSACALSARNQAQFAADGRLFSCAGSPTSANGTFFTDFSRPDDPATPVVRDAQGDIVSGDEFGRDSETLQVGSGRDFIPGFTPFNFAPYNYFQRPDERYTFGAFANYEINDAIKPYVEAMFMDDRTRAQIAPSGNFGNTLTINCDNPLLSASQQATVCRQENLVGFSFDDPNTPANEASPATVFVDQNGNPFTQGNLQILRRNVEGGGRVDDLQHTTYRIVAGSRGDISKGLSYDAYYQYGRTVFAETYFNDFSVNRLGRALDVVTGANGQPVCRSVVNGSDPNCVPYDILAAGGVTPAALSYLQTPGFQRGNTQETVANASVTALLGEYGFQSPLAAEGIGLNFGVEYRKEALELNTDTAFSTGDLAGQGGPTIGLSGSFNVKEAFAELRVPLVADRPFFESLSVTGGYRYSRYKVASNSFSTNTYKVEGEYSPFPGIRFRGSYNRAVRAPNVVELFQAQSVSLDGSTDPCAGEAVGGLVNGNTAAQCALTGVSASQFGNIQANSAEQYNGFQGGNPALRPEKATTKTAGLVFQPRFFRGFAATIDYFDIKINNQIGQIGADVILTQCINTGDQALCGLINRDQFGSLFRTTGGFVVDTQLNAGSISTRGIDVGASYSHRVGNIGSLGASFVGTYLDKLVLNPAGDLRFDCAGLYGAQCGNTSGLAGANPKYRSKVRLTYTSPIGVGLSGQWRYFSRVRRDTLSSDADLTGTTAPGNARLPATSYFDLALTARVGDRYEFRLGANNLLDKDPPTAVTPAPLGNGNTYPQVYDALGRYLFAGVTLNF